MSKAESKANEQERKRFQDVADKLEACSFALAKLDAGDLIGS